MFTTAYKQLTPAQRSFVDNAVYQLEQGALRANERISSALHRPIPQSIVDRSNGMIENRLVQAAIAERVNEIAAEQELTAPRWVKEVRTLAFSSMGNYVRTDEDGACFDLTQLAPEHWAAVQQVEIEDQGDGMTLTRTKRKIKIKLYDKMAALKMLGQYMALLEPDNPHWKADVARMQQEALPAGATPADAALAYESYRQ